MYFSRIFKIKEGKLETFKAWMSELGTTRREEAIQTFEYEYVTREVFSLFKGTDGNYYVVGFNEATETPLSSDKLVPLNQEHNIIKKECLEPVSEPGEVLLDLSI